MSFFWMGYHFKEQQWDSLICRCYIGFEPEFFLGSCQPLSVSTGQPLDCGTPPGEKLS